MNLYKERLMDHYRRPRNKGSLHNPDFTSGTHNPSCGDSITVYGCMKKNILSEIRFEGSGCVISQAAASLVMEFCTGKALNEVAGLHKQDVLALVGMYLGPTRLRCALLPLEALQEGLQIYLKERHA